MNQLRKNSIRLRRIAAQRLTTMRRLLRSIDLSLALEINSAVLKISVAVKRRE